MTNAQTEAQAIARKLQDVIEGHSWRLNIDKATDTIATALAAKDAELEELRSKCQALDDECQQSMLDIARERDRADRAEAQLAEANRKIAEKDRALEPFAGIADTEDAVGRDDPDDDRVWVVQAHGCQIGDLSIENFRAARRALEAQGGENG